jgi:hypothetical protein
MNQSINDLSGLLNVEQAARALGVSRWWIYEHQDELPIIRLGTHPKAPIRIDRDDLRIALMVVNSKRAGRVEIR